MNISDILELFVGNMLAIPVLFPPAHDLANISFRHVYIRDPTEVDTTLSLISPKNACLHCVCCHPSYLRPV